MTWPRRSSIAVLVLLALVVTGCGRDQPAQVGTESIAAADRIALPDVAGTTLTGTRLDLADLRGKVVVLNSWASWCGPCRDEVPAFVALDAAVDPEQVAVVGLNVSDEHSAAATFAEDFSMTYPSIVDADGAILRTIPGVPPSALPSTVILDRQGRIAARIIGPADPQALSRLVAQVSAET